MKQLTIRVHLELKQTSFDMFLNKIQRVFYRQLCINKLSQPRHKYRQFYVCMYVWIY